MNIRTIVTAAAMFFATVAGAQCTFRNTAFKSGEFLSYNLYYNWKFVWVKAGNASMSTVRSHYRGRQAYRASLITRTNSRLDNVFVMRDTLLCYNTTQMEPLYFRKGAREGDRYTVDEVFYSYPDGRCHLRLHRRKNDGKNEWRSHVSHECVYDMLSIFLRARSFNPTGWKKGNEVHFPMADGKNTNPAMIEYLGKKVIKADNGLKYRCLQLAYKELEHGKYKEIVRFYVSDDANHVPVRLDMFLRFGSAKAFLVGTKGLRNPVSSIVK